MYHFRCNTRKASLSALHARACRARQAKKCQFFVPQLIDMKNVTRSQGTSSVHQLGVFFATFDVDISDSSSETDVSQTSTSS